jgi:para-nitrobenzyl esterase
MLTGLTADEGSSMLDTYGQATPDALAATIKERYGALAPEFAQLYPAKSAPEAGEAAKQLERDRGPASAWLWAKRRMAGSRQPIYLYYFTHVEPGPQAQRYGAFHSSEMPYVFGTLDRADRPFAQEDRLLSGTMGGYWANWIRTGDPNGPGLPAWPRLRLDTPALLEIGAASHARPVLAPDRLSLFERDAGQGMN